jgi:hypothetical protein
LDFHSCMVLVQVLLGRLGIVLVEVVVVVYKRF